MANLVLPTKTIEKLTALKEPEAFKRAVFDMVDVDAIDLPLNRILTAVYLKYGVSAGGILMPDQKKDEDIWQNKVALVLKVGPTAFVDTPEWNFAGFKVQPGDWITFKIGNGSQIELFAVPCRIVMDNYVETRVHDPRVVTS
jgi:co-chaperonin GroES (HSP10)